MECLCISECRITYVFVFVFASNLICPWIITIWVNRFVEQFYFYFYFYFFRWTDFIYVNRFVEQIFFLCEQIFFMWTNFFLLMFQIKPTKPIKPSWSNCTAIGRKTNPNCYASVLIITKPISIGSVTNLKKYRANQTVHTPSSRVAAPTPDSSDTASGIQRIESPFFFFFFSIHSNSDRNRSRNGSIPTETAIKSDRYDRRNRLIWAADHHSSASCGLVRKKKKKR